MSYQLTFELDDSNLNDLRNKIIIEMKNLWTLFEYKEQDQFLKDCNSANNYPLIITHNNKRVLNDYELQTTQCGCINDKLIKDKYLSIVRIQIIYNTVWVTNNLDVIYSFIYNSFKNIIKELRAEIKRRTDGGRRLSDSMSKLKIKDEPMLIDKKDEENGGSNNLKSIKLSDQKNIRFIELVLLHKILKIKEPHFIVCYSIKDVEFYALISNCRHTSAHSPTVNDDSIINMIHFNCDILLNKLKGDNPDKKLRGIKDSKECWYYFNNEISQFKNLEMSVSLKLFLSNIVNQLKI